MVGSLTFIPLPLLNPSQAVINGHSDCVSLLMASGADVLLGDKDGLAPIHLACLRPSLSIADLLLEEEPRCLTVQDYQGRTAIHAASHIANLPLCEFLLKKGADVNARDFKNRTPLLWCLMQSNIGRLLTESTIKNCAQALIEKHQAQVTLCDDKLRNCFHYAAYYGLFQVFEFLEGLEQLSLTAVDANGQSVLFPLVAGLSNDFACEETVNSILTQSVDPFSARPRTLLPIHVAIARGKLATATALFDCMVQQNEKQCERVRNKQKASLLQLCANTEMHSLGLRIMERQPSLVTHLDRQGNTLLHSIAKGGSLELLEGLLHAEGKEKVLAQLSHTNRRGQTPWHLASGLDRMEIVQEFVRLLGAHPEALQQALCCHDTVGITPVHYAALRGSYFVLEYFLSLSPSVAGLLTKRQQTLLHAAASGSADARCIRLLIQSGANVDGLDASGRSALFYTLRSGGHSKLSALHLLITECGANTNLVTHGGLSFAMAVAETEECESILKLLEETEEQE